MIILIRVLFVVLTVAGILLVASQTKENPKMRLDIVGAIMSAVVVVGLMVCQAHLELFVM